MIWENENAFDAIVGSAVDAMGTPAHIIKAVIAKESSFNPRAIKAEPQIKDASRGLMQLLLATARALGYRGEPDGLFDPVASIEGGAKYLARLYAAARKKGGGWEDALSAYNAGWKKESGKILFGVPRKKADGTYVNQAYVNDVKVYAGYFKGEIPEAAVRRYHKTKVLKFAVPALGLLLAVGVAALLYVRYRPAV